MNEFIPMEEDLKIFNDLKTKINRVKINTNLEIKRSSEAIKKKQEYKKDIIFILLLSIGVFIISCFAVFLPNSLQMVSGAIILLLFLSFCLMCFFIFYYIKRDNFFEQYLTNINLSKIYLDTEELKLINKFMNKEKLAEYLVENELKLSLKIAKDVLKSVYYQRKYTEYMANNIIDELNLK